MDPSFDTWTSGFLFGSVMGLFLFLVLLTGRNKKNYPIAFLILAFSLILSQYVLYWTNYDEVFPHFDLLPTMCYYVTGPLLYVYFLNLYKRVVNFNFALHFLPAFLMLISNVIFILNHLGISVMEPPFMFFVYNQEWFISPHMIIYTLLCANLVLRNKPGESEYQMVRYKWSKVLISLYSLFIFSYISYYVLRNFSFFSAEWDYMISIMMTVSIYTIGYFIFKQPSVFDGEMFANLFLPIKNKDESFESSMLNEFYENVTNYMENKKPYIDNELRLVNLADQIGFSTHLLSRIINKKSGMNFNNFVNEYRLKEAEELLLSNDDHNIKTIYFDVGFNNKTSFYKAFKKKNHCTPSEFISRKSLSLE
jgi:AraC-like DNA-binding protein